jgi:hypothetical protein
VLSFFDGLPCAVAGIDCPESPIAPVKTALKPDPPPLRVPS